MTALVWPESGLPKKRKFFFPMAVGRRIINALHCGPKHLVRITNEVAFLNAIVAEELHDMEDRGEVIQHETGLYQLSAAMQQAEQERKRNGT